jgi:hypothetical protein
MIKYLIFQLAAVWLFGLLSPAAEPIRFNRDVRPILSDRCWGCHGPDAKTKNIPLRLDSETAIKADLGKGRRAVVPGEPETSQIIARILTDKKGLRMPPIHTGFVVKEQELETLKQWIREGAPWEAHWSYIKPMKSALPAVRQSGWAKTPIDHFLLARLEKAGLTPSRRASAEQLLRRVSLDLTGLPAPQALEQQFLANPSPAEWEKLVDALLASPRYGERMAAPWLDAARYADTNGYQYDGPRTMWRWRDWVLESFNRNQPWNDFIIDQLAGDMLPQAKRAQIIATGFNRNHRINAEGGIIPEEYIVEYAADRVETTSSVFLGITLGCARCHNHKYDPLTQKDFYRMYAYFDNIPEYGIGMKYGNSRPMLAAPLPEEEAKWQALQQQQQQQQQELAKLEQKHDGAWKKWQRANGAKAAEAWTPTRGREHYFAFEDQSGKGVRGNAINLDGTAIHDTKQNSRFDIMDQFTLSLWVKPTNVNGAIFGQGTDNPQSRRWLLRLDEGRVRFDLITAFGEDMLEAVSEVKLPPGEWSHVSIFWDTAKEGGDSLHFWLNGQEIPRRLLRDQVSRPFRNNAGSFPQTMAIGRGLGKTQRFAGMVDEVMLHLRRLSIEEHKALAGDVNIAARLAWRDAAAPEQLRNVWRQLQQREQELASMEMNFPTVMVMRERPVKGRTHLLLRGAYDKPGEEVSPGVPESLLPQGGEQPMDRLGLARWIASRDNPLTARVTVNRFWQMIFGTGLVKTSEDFGAQGEWPSHPELLDWLAVDFMEHNWDVKRLLKMIVMSEAYLQTSETTPELLQKDRDNRLVSRGPRFRMSAGMVRDVALAHSGLLVEKQGGPSVKPYQPAGLWKELTMQGLDYDQDHGPALWRRSIYTYWKRTVAPPMLANFDAAGRESCVVRESRTNTPLQALNLMNDVTFLEAARLLGQRVLQDGGTTDEEKLRFAFRTATARLPRESEMKLLRSSLQYHRDYFRQQPEAAARYLKVGEKPGAAGISPTDLAPWMSLASLLLNMDEAVTRQ